MPQKTFLDMIPPRNGRCARSRFIIGSAAVYAAIGVQVAAKAAQFEFKAATSLALDHPANARQLQMWAAIEQESGGRIHTQLFPNSQLGGDLAMLSQVRLGALGFQLIGAGNLASVVPAADITQLGFTFKDAEEGFHVTDGPLGGYVRQEIAAKGMYAFRSFWDSGVLDISSGTHPIRTPVDLRGFKVRVAESKIFIDLFKELGASPVTLSLNEVYTGLQTKIIDGMAAGLVTMEAAKYYEVQKFISMTNHGWAGLWMIMNENTWKSLPADLQGIIERNNTKYAVIERRDIASLNASLAEKLASQGVLFNQVDQAPFRARLRSYYERWAATFGPTAWGLLQSSLGRKMV
jgi:TRAP-type transport system periplasmic protein